MEQGTQEWREARGRGIGGSEISALYLLPDGSCAHPWLTPHQLWMEKTGRITPREPDPATSPQLYVGRELERPVRNLYSTFSGREVVDGVTMLRHPECPVLVANTDGQQVNVDGKDGPGVYEGKTTSVFNRRSWEDDDGCLKAPDHYQLQVQHYLACTGLRWGTVVVFLAGDREPIRWIDIERHEGIISDMLERSERWWHDHVELDVPPPVDDTRETGRRLADASPKDDGRVIILPDEFATVIDWIDNLAQVAKNAKAERQRVVNIVTAAMGSAAYGLTYDGRGLSLKLDKAGRRTLRTIGEAGMARVTRVSRPRRTFISSTYIDQIKPIARLAWGQEANKT